MYGQSMLQGYTLSDKVCMADQADLGGMMGRMQPLCIDPLQFLAVEDIEPDFSFPAQGIIGLAPNQKTLPWVLKGLYMSEDASVSFHKDGDNTVIGFNEKKP